jgi:hypothetical protein
VRYLIGIMIGLIALPTTFLASPPASADAGVARFDVVSTQSKKVVTGIFWEVTGEGMQSDGAVVLPAGGSRCTTVIWALRRDAANSTLPQSMNLVGQSLPAFNFDVPVTQQVCAPGDDRQTLTKIGPVEVKVAELTDTWTLAPRAGLVTSVGTRCLPNYNWADYVEGVGDYGDIYYLPALKTEPLRVAGLVDIDSTDSKCRTGYASGRVTDQKRGSGKGHIVFTYDDCEGLKNCTVSLAGKKYNLKDKKTRVALECRRQAGLRPIVEDELCIPVPKTTGKYRFELYASSGRQLEKGRGWEFVCRYSYGTTRCAWYFDGDETYVDTERRRRDVIVQPTDVLVRTVK